MIGLVGRSVRKKGPQVRLLPTASCLCSSKTQASLPVAGRKWCPISARIVFVTCGHGYDAQCAVAYLGSLNADDVVAVGYGLDQAAVDQRNERMKLVVAAEGKRSTSW